MEKKLWQLTGPIFIETLMMSLMGSIDVVMLARFSDEAVAAVSVANQVLFLIQVMACIVTTGTGILCAQAIGAGETQENQNALIVASILLNAGFGILLTAGICLFDSAILGMLNLEGSAFTYAGDYLKIISLFVWVQMVSSVFSVVIRAYGHTRECMYVSVMMNLSNIVLNYLLIFGKFGFPEMGIKGAALATVIGRLWAFIVYGLLLMHIRRKQSGLCLAVSKIGYYAGSVITYGLPAAGEQISYNCSQFFVMVFITMLGTKSVTAYSYLNTCVGFIYMFSTALGQGTAIMIGWNVGAANYAEADRQCRFSGRCSLIVSMLVMFVVTIFRKSVFGLFTTDSEIISLACMVLLSNYIREIGRSQNLVYVNALRAAGDVKYPFLVGLVSMWGLSVGMTYVLGIRMGLGLMGVWIALGMDECFRAAMMHIRWHKKFRYSDVLCFFTQV